MQKEQMSRENEAKKEEVATMIQRIDATVLFVRDLASPRIAQRDGAQFVGYMGDCVVAPSQGYQMAVFDELSSLSPQVLLRLFR
jgi:hypothetical protein